MAFRWLTSFHTGGAVGSIPTAPTIKIKDLANVAGSYRLGGLNPLLYMGRYEMLKPTPREIERRLGLRKKPPAPSAKKRRAKPDEQAPRVPLRRRSQAR